AEVALTDPLQQRVGADARPDGAWSWSHRPFDRLVRVGRNPPAAEAPQPHPLPVHHGTGVPTGRTDPLPHFFDVVFYPSGGDDAVRDITGHSSGDIRSLVQESVRPPILLAGDVVVDTPEAERFEPPRGSRADVSLVVVAVDDYRPLAVKFARGALVELLERDVDGAADVFLRVVSRRQHLNELRVPLGDQSANLVSVNRSGHRLHEMRPSPSAIRSS